MPRPIAKLTLVEFIEPVGTPRSNQRQFEVVKAENTIHYAIGQTIPEREVQSLINRGIRTVLIQKK